MSMHAEREELVKGVFPRLRKLCESRGVIWGDVDLRRGVTDDQKAEGAVFPPPSGDPTAIAEPRIRKTT